MKHLLLTYFVLVMSSVTAFAQEFTFVDVRSTQIKTIDLSKVKTNTIYDEHRERTPGTVAMIVGGSMLVAAAGMYYALDHTDSHEGINPWAVPTVAFVVGGISTLGISGLVFVINKIAHKPVTKTVSVYNDPAHVGLAYNF
jgi:hypothetical protein